MSWHETGFITDDAPEGTIVFSFYKLGVYLYHWFHFVREGCTAVPSALPGWSLANLNLHNLQLYRLRRIACAEEEHGSDRWVLDLNVV